MFQGNWLLSCKSPDLTSRTPRNEFESIRQFTGTRFRTAGTHKKKKRMRRRKPNPMFCSPSDRTAYGTLSKLPDRLLGQL